MKSGRRMRTARKMRRIYSYTVLAWALGIVVYWIVSALNSLSNADVTELTAIDVNSTINHVIYFVLMVFVLIAVLLIEFLIFGRRKNRGTTASTTASPSAEYSHSLDVPDTPARSIPARRRKPSGRRKRIIIEPAMRSDTPPEE